MEVLGVVALLDRVTDVDEVVLDRRANDPQFDDAVRLQTFL